MNEQENQTVQAAVDFEETDALEDDSEESLEEKPLDEKLLHSEDEEADCDEDDDQDYRELYREVSAKLTETEKEMASLKDRYMRALADYDNLRRRSAKEVLDATSKGTEYFVKKLLPVLDTLDSAMRQLVSADIEKDVKDGLEMFSIQLSDTLEKEGLKEIPAKGQKFDPNLHEAMCKKSRQDLDDEIVITEFERGYIFKDRVLRPAKVEINQH